MKAENWLPRETAQDIALGLVAERGEYADQIVRFRPAGKPAGLARQRLGVGLGLADFLDDRVGIVGQSDMGDIPTDPISTFSSCRRADS